MGDSNRARTRVATVGRPPDADQRAVREAILQAALRLFGDKGFEACSLQEIAARAGVTKPMVHYYYESKVGLLRAVFESVLAKMLDRLRALAVDEVHSVRERIDLLARDHRESCENQPDEARFMRRLIFIDPPRALSRLDRKRMKQMLGVIYGSFCAMAEQGVRSGELHGEPRVIAALLHAIIGYTPMLEVIFEHEPRGHCGRFTEEMVASLWTGIVPARDQGVVK